MILSAIDFSMPGWGEAIEGFVAWFCLMGVLLVIRYYQVNKNDEPFFSLRSPAILILLLMLAVLLVSLIQLIQRYVL